MAAETVGAYALSEAGSGSDAFALATRAALKGEHYRAQRPQAVDHQRQRGRIVLLFAIDPDAGYKGITAFLIEREFPGISRRQERGQARNPRVIHLRADSGRLPGAERERHWRDRQGIQDRDRDVERRAHRHRRADARVGRGALEYAGIR